MVKGTGLENRRPERVPEFESLTLRQFWGYSSVGRAESITVFSGRWFESMLTPLIKDSLQQLYIFWIKLCTI